MSYRSQINILAAAIGLLLAGPDIARSGDQAKGHETIRVDLRLRTGGGLSGPVLDYTDHGLVLLHDHTPYVFAWEELEVGSAYGTRRALLAFERGGKEHLTAEDHFQLGLFAHRHGRDDLAANEFRPAMRMDSTYRARIKAATADGTRADVRIGDQAESDTGAGSADNRDAHPQADRDEGGPHEPTIRFPTVAAGPLHTHREEVREVYEVFGAKVREVLGREVELIESEHFLIWTDWRRAERDRLAEWCESMYAALCKQFDLDPAADIFPAKCPVFCWRSKAQFQRFARHFDGFDSSDSIGYTRSIPQSGHVHVVLLRQGRSLADFDRFACTLVHEGTHAFMHRLYSSKLIPHWVNEGFADLMTERVLGDRCPAGENAALLAAQIIHYEWPVGELLRHEGPIEVYQYPVAHSVVGFLESRGSERFAGFIRDLKAGHPLEAALASNYGIKTIDELEAQWRTACRRADRESQKRISSGSGQPTSRNDR